MHVRSYAKINWTLDVLFRREDGYHELRTIYQTISLHDSLVVSALDSAIEVTCDDPRVPCDETNLAHRAATLLREAASQTKGARIEIKKRIPVAAGLGGGSSNAAATLLALERLWRVEIPHADMVQVAATLGSDVPFFLLGGTALGISRGEEVYPLEEVGGAHLLVVNPGFAIPTAAAYAMLSRLTRVDAARIIPFTLIAAKGIRELPLAASNDFDEVVSAAYPKIAELKRRLVSLGAQRAMLSGSGATVFGVFDKLETSEQAQAEMSSAGYWSQCARAINREEYNKTMFD